MNSSGSDTDTAPPIIPTLTPGETASYVDRLKQKYQRMMPKSDFSGSSNNWAFSRLVSLSNERRSKGEFVKKTERHIFAVMVLSFGMLPFGRSHAVPGMPQRSGISSLTAVSVPLANEDAARCAADPAQLLRCQNACSSGGAAIRNFCNSLPDPRMRSGCFALELGSETACQGWCYWHFGK